MIGASIVLLASRRAPCADPHGNSDRLKSAIGVALIHGLLGYALLTGLGTKVVRSAGDALKVFDIPATAPPPPVEKAAPADGEAEGAASPQNLKASPSPVVTPPPEIRLDVPPPIAAAPAPALASDTSAGASSRPGPGAGSGGVGAGTGSGSGGSGTGSGGIATRARQVAGRIVDADYPRTARKARAEGSVLVRFTVGRDGRAKGCTVLESSGHPELDATTCRLIEQRFRFEPARNAQGDPIPDIKAWNQIWWLE